MSPSDFSKALLKSASSDAPPNSAKNRAIEGVERALRSTAAVSVGSAAGAAATTKMLLAVTASALIAGAGGLGGGYALGHASAPAPHPYTQIQEAPPVLTSEAQRLNEPAPYVAPVAVPTATAVQGPPLDVCESVSEEGANKCSTNGGRSMTFAIRSNCSRMPVDVFWVDSSCHEVFRGMVAPTETFWQDSYDGHVFHVRDHATHRLMKEVTATAVEGAPERLKVWKGSPTELPPVTIDDNNKPMPEAPPADCSHGGGRAAHMHIQNNRKNEAIALVLLDFDTCRERDTRVIEAGAKLDFHTSEGHAFRIRDAAGALLLDIPPTSLDTTTYFTVP